jgi:hypothetical protein
MLPGLQDQSEWLGMGYGANRMLALIDVIPYVFTADVVTLVSGVPASAVIFSKQSVAK